MFGLNSCNEHVGLKVVMAGRLSDGRRSNVALRESKANDLFVHLIVFKKNGLVYVITFYCCKLEFTTELRPRSS